MNKIQRTAPGLAGPMCLLLGQQRGNLAESFKVIWRFFSALALILTAMQAHAADYQWLGPTAASNSNASLTVSATYTTNFGVAFTTGSSGPYRMQWAKLNLASTGTVPPATITAKLSLRNTTNSTAYSAAAGATEYAVDTLTIAMPTTANTTFTLNLDPTTIPNIAAYAMSPNTSYALILYDVSSSFIGIQRTTGYAVDTTNDYYTLNDGFAALNTFRNNTKYSNNVSSYPSLHFFFGTWQVTYNANSATSGTPPSSQPKYAAVDLSLATNSGNLAQTGNSFLGWNTAANGTGTDYAESATYSSAASLTLYAKWGSANSAPTAGSVSISGTVAVGQTLTGSYSYNDADSNAESGSTYQWYRQNDASGAGRAAISGATGTTTAGSGSLPTAGTIPGYTVAVADAGKYIVVGVVPKAAAGTTPGTEAFSSASTQVPNVPGAPTVGTATAGNAQISLTFSAPGSDGGATVSGYTVTCTSSDGGATGSNTGSASPIVVSSLTNDKTYTCTVKATNSTGDSAASAASSSAVPVAPVAGVCGSANSSTLLTVAPSGGPLCSVGSVSGSVTTNAGTYTWSCSGTNGGAASGQCSAPRGFTVTASAGTNGSISPSGAQVVAYNATPSFTLVPLSGYAVESVGGSCGGTRSGNNFTAGAVATDCSVTASFVATASAPSIPTLTSGVTATLSAVGCTAVDTNATRFVAATGAPANTAFPFGLLDFTLNGCASSVTVTVTYSAPLPSGTATFYKQINGAYNANPFPVTIDRNTNSVTFTLRDNQAGEDDNSTLGVIRDPSGLSFAAAPMATPTSIPTLSEWGLIALASLLGLFGIWQVRRGKGVR